MKMKNTTAKLKKIRGKELHFKTLDEYKEYCEGKDIQECNVKIVEEFTDEEFCEKFKGLMINIRTGKIINRFPTGDE